MALSEKRKAALKSSGMEHLVLDDGREAFVIYDDSGRDENQRVSTRKSEATCGVVKFCDNFNFGTVDYSNMSVVAEDEDLKIPGEAFDELRSKHAAEDATIH